ncbi:MAG: phosphoethanolamine transferase domain-containing protein, partial [Pseudohongiella sp.]|nr:phosphoethanolamine transferase domain-containing protein [Pseudohongiella sp.]
MSALRTTGSNGVILVAALFFTIAYNLAFFRNVYATYSEPGNAGFLISLSLVLISSIAVFLAVALNKFTLKPALMLLFPVAAAGSYFMNSYNVIIDSAMIQNSVMTDSREVFDLLSLRLLLYVALLGVLPAFLVYKLPLRCDTPLREITARFKLIAVLLVVIAGNLFLMADQYTSFIREHKDLRYYMNPLTLIYSSVKYVSSVAEASAGPRAVIGNDAYIDRDSQVRKLVVLIVGEATRADHWSLNGYERETNDALLVHDIVNFPEVSSCATSTAFSVPCMFSLSTFDNFKLGEAKAQENVLDVLSKVGANVLWRDNNSDSKGVAIAVAFEDFRSPEVNPVCDTECRDIGMLSGLDDYITQHPEGD